MGYENKLRDIDTHLQTFPLPYLTFLSYFRQHFRLSYFRYTVDLGTLDACMKKFEMLGGEKAQSRNDILRQRWTSIDVLQCMSTAVAGLEDSIFAEL